MTVKPESKFGRDIMKNINAFWDPHTITSKAGRPDLYGIKNGIVIWLELKCIKQNSIRLSPFQITWNINNFQHGGKNYYIVRDTRSKVLKLYDGNKGRELKELGFKCPCSLQLEPPTNWQRLESYLFS
jgi:hypothetical protein